MTPSTTGDNFNPDLVTSSRLCHTMIEQLANINSASEWGIPAGFSHTQRTRSSFIYHSYSWNIKIETLVSKEEHFGWKVCQVAVYRWEISVVWYRGGEAAQRWWQGKWRHISREALQSQSLWKYWPAVGLCASRSPLQDCTVPSSAASKSWAGMTIQAGLQTQKSTPTQMDSKVNTASECSCCKENKSISVVFSIFEANIHIWISVLILYCLTFIYLQKS